MQRQAGIGTDARKPRDWKAVYVAAGLFLLAVMLVLSLLAAQLIQELSRLRSASTDNVQWSMAQTQVELLVLETAVDDAIHNETPEMLDEVRQRFDIFYSRIDTLRSGSVFSNVTQEAETRQILNRIMDTLNRAIPLIDGPDSALGDALPAFEKTLGSMRQDVREITLAGVRLLAEQSDQDRQAFSSLLLRTGLVTAGVMAAMFLALFLAVWQFRIARLRTEDLQTQNLLYKSAINASLEAIIVSDENGRILDFNPAAEQLFGYKREHAIGVNAEKLIIPKEDLQLHRERRVQFIEQFHGNESNLSGRLEINAMRASGEVFPAEVSVGLTRRGEGRIIVTYMRDISERKRAQQNLTQARDDAVATAKAKSDFLAVMSHEMRTPLNGVMGLLDMLSETRLTRKQRDYVETAISSGEILQNHIDDVLNVTRIEAGVTRLNPVRFEIAPLLTELKKMNDPAARRRGNTIETETAAGATFCDQDRHGLRQVLINLVGNAVKFTENGTIVLKAAPHGEDGWIEFTVSDTGIGISQEDARRIFDDFVMLDPSYKRTAPGSGLGLGISRRLVDLMGGEIGVESEPGKGSRFYLRLPPLEVSEHKPAEAERSEAVTPVVAQANLSVLLVEDNETNRFVAREMLKKHGCRITEAHDGIEGVEKAAGERFDVIFMDVSMPRLDGIGATRAIRESEGLSRDTPIIGLTAHALPDERRRLEEAGMVDCIVKPLRSAKVREVIGGLLLERSVSNDSSSDTDAAEDDPGLIDHETLADLTEALPPELFERQLGRFKTELAESRARFCGAADQPVDLDELAACAHKMAGSAAVFGAIALRVALLDVESAAKHGAREQLSPLCDTASQTAQKTLQALSDLTA
ncbi:ATP-binding protein [Martelella radicis]|uniref:histidine kinase n=1 Tax=Martelella radicis TaxID=1397476 RepID=A0A7W6KGH4_9HYPH|nr:ATP-binding protein [Martelella radicis]MBB4120630.1 PAS domain S-box-containing protein [Martelella radicis]